MDSELLDVINNSEIEEVLQQYQGVVVSCSGGPDSTALFRVFCEIAKRKKNFPLLIYHVNFGLRGKDSNEDQRFCEQLAVAHNVPIKSVQVPESESVKILGNGTGIQSWAREIRRRDWQQLQQEGWCIATGHTENDLAENILLRLIRGTSTANMLGMERFKAGIWRPFIDTPKGEILKYLRQIGQDYRWDQSNDKPVYRRNYIRHEIIPRLNQLAPGFEKRLVRTAKEAVSLAHFAQQIADGGSPEAMPQAVQNLKTVAFLRNLGFTASLTRPQIDQVENFLINAHAAPVNLPEDMILLRDHDGNPLLKQAKSLAKGHRRSQHDRSLTRLKMPAYLTGKAYVILRKSPVFFKIGGDSGSRQGSAWQISTVPASQKLTFKGYNKTWILKDVLNRWKIPPHQRKDFQIVWQGGQPICLTDGSIYAVPSDSGERLTPGELSGILGGP